MSKNFQQQVIDQYYKQNENLDPYVYVTPEVDQYMKAVNTYITGKFILSFVLSDVILAPLQTIVTSLQLSVQKHKNIYQSQQARTKELAKLNTQMTVHEKRKFELMIRAGGKTIPYTAPVYNGYKQTLDGLKSQGWKAFFKGLTFRSIATAIYLLPFQHASILISTQQVKQGPLYQYLKMCLYCLGIDILSNPLHILQNRYILQNRIAEFRSIRKPFSTARKLANYGELFKGSIFYLINNCVSMMARFPLYLSLIDNNPNTTPLYGYYMLGQLFVYPFSTAFKRLQCQTQRYVGMIPVRYQGLFHALRVIAYEEGVRGLWRGFGLHAVQTLIRLKFLQYCNQIPKIAQ